jgi:sacsin
MAEDEIVELDDVGQYEPLTVRLKGLIQTYPKNVGILKEFIQNADDAEASQVRIILDGRQHTGPLLAQEMTVLQGPSLLVFNDKPFKETDFANIRRIGDSAKVGEETKTGRFGLGFNSCYNVTDYPCLLSRNRLILFDPHKRLPRRNPERSAVGYELTNQLWEQSPGLLRPFEVAGLTPGQVSFEGTVFRLPLRTAEHQSEICPEPFTLEDCDQIFEQLSQLGEELLLFLKHVLEVRVDEILPGKRLRQRLHVQTLNVETVEAHRSRVRQAMSRSSQEASQAPERVSYLHEVQVTRGKAQQTALWRVVGGLFTDPKGELRAAAEAMQKFGQKAIPWAGAAARLEKGPSGELAAKAIPGKIYCALPLAKGDSCFPVHLNGFFDVDSARQGLTADASLLGKDGVRHGWNQALLQHAVAPAYTALLAELTKEVNTPSAETLYRLFPDPERALPGALQLFPQHVYTLLAQERVIRCVGPSAPWARIGDLVPPPAEWQPQLQEPLRAKGMPIPEPPLPAHIAKGFTATGIKLNYLTSATLREWLRVKQPVSTPLEQAADPALRRREWVVHLLNFCKKDIKTGAELVGLPLAILEDGQLCTFWTWTIHLADKVERALVRQPHWFLEEQFRKETQLNELPQAGLIEMTPAHLVARVKASFAQLGAASPCPWNPAGPQPPNTPWLTEFYGYFSSEKARNASLGGLKELAVVPDERGHLHRPGRTDTPLLLTEEQARDTELCQALEAFSIPRITGSEGLISAIRAFTLTHPQGGIRQLGATTLVDALAASQKAWTEQAQSYDPKIHDVLLDWLSQPAWLDSLTLQHIKVLRALPIFPTADLQLVRLDAPQVYQPADSTPPPTAGQAHLLKVSTARRKLLTKIGVLSLSRELLIRNVLLPSYVAMPPPEQVQVLDWLRDNLRKACTEANKAGDEGGAALKKLVMQAPLVRCRDGKLYPAASLYDPRKQLIKDVLGDTALIPDTQATYSDATEDWLSFFSTLGMAEAPHPQDLLVHVDKLIKQAEAEGPQGVSESLIRVYEYVADHWSELKNATVRNGNGHPVTLDQALANRRWLPAQTDPAALSQYAAAKLPQARLYAPSELYPVHLGHLVASQSPLMPFVKRDFASFREALGIPSEVPLALVMTHFDSLLVSHQAAPDTAMKALGDSLARIYEYFGTLFQKNPGAVQQVRAHYANRPCLWDKSRHRFWQPRHVFLEHVPFFEPLRVQLRIAEPLIDQGYAVLGRRELPQDDDFIAWLEDVAALHSGEPLPPKLLTQVMEVLRRLSLSFETAAMLEPMRARLCLPVKGGQLARATEVLRDDAPWYAEKLTPGAVLLVQDEVPMELLRAAEVQRLSRQLKEQLSQEPDLSQDPRFIEDCETLGELLRSQEFTRGLRRLIQAEHEKADPKPLGWLSTLSVVPAAQLDSRLWLGKRLVGSAAADFYVDRPHHQIFLREESADLASFHLAQAIKQELDEEQRLSDTSALTKILESYPTGIDSLLTRLKIPQLTEQPSVEDSWGLPPADLEPEPPTTFFEDQPPEPEPSNESAVDESAVDESAVDEVPAEHVEEAPLETPVPGPTRPGGPWVRSPRPRNGAGWRGEPPRSPVPPRDAPAMAEGFVVPRPESLAAAPTASAPASSGAMQALSSGANSLVVPPEGSTFVGSEQRPSQEPSLNPMGILPPIKPGHGHSTWTNFRRGTEVSRHRAVTYIHPNVPGAEAAEGHVDPQAAAELRQAALKRVLAHEHAEHRQPQPPRDDASGCSLESVDGSGARYIEVKGLSGPWTENGVWLSPGQFDRAQKLGDGFWLYVVEYAMDEASSVVHSICNPAALITQYRLDPGWRGLASASLPQAAPPRPEVGGRILMEDGVEGVITGVEGESLILSLQVKILDGTKRQAFYQPNKMKILPNEG